jgi:hypothetical protein
VLSNVEVAVTVKLVAVSFAATVKSPLALMVVIAELLPVTVQVTVWGGLFVPCTAAKNCCVAPR